MHKAISLAILLTSFQMQAQMKPVPKSPVTITPSQAPQLPALSTAKRVKRSEAIDLVKQKKAVYVDVRSPASYSLGHIRGAINIPHSQFMNRLREVPPGKMIITYCACVEEHTAALTVLELNQHGMKNAAALTGGWNDWVAAKLPIAKGLQ